MTVAIMRIRHVHSHMPAFTICRAVKIVNGEAATMEADTR